MPLPTLEPDVDVFHQQPDSDLLDAECGPCAAPQCVPVAEVGWTDRDGHRSAVVAGPSCLPAAVEQARSSAGVKPAITVDVPAWTLVDLAGLLGVLPVVVASWTGERLLDPEPKPTASAPTRFLADQAHLARGMHRLVEVGLVARTAHRLLTGDGRDVELAAALLAALGDHRTPRRLTGGRVAPGVYA